MLSCGDYEDKNIVKCGPVTSVIAAWKELISCFFPFDASVP